MKRGQEALTFRDGRYMRCRVCYIERNSYRAVDGPVVRVTDGGYSWRVDGCSWAYPIREGK